MTPPGCDAYAFLIPFLFIMTLTKWPTVSVVSYLGMIGLERELLVRTVCKLPQNFMVTSYVCIDCITNSLREGSECVLF